MPPTNPGAPAAPRVELRVDDDRRLIFVTIAGPATGKQVAEPVSEMFRNRPELTGYDMLYDIREYTGDVEAEHIKPIADAYAASQPDPARPTRTAFLTFDPNFQLWAASMDFHFPGRTHRAFREPAEAEEFLNSPR